MIGKVIKCEYSTGKNMKITAKHYHSWFEFYYLQNGTGNCFVENTLYTLKPGDIMVIPPGVIHQSSYTSASRTRLLINISDLYPDLVFRIVSGGYVIRNSGISWEAFQIMRNIEKEYLEKDEFSEELISGELYKLLVLLARHENHYADTKSLSPHISATIEYIESNYGTDISISQIARKTYISREHLSRLFKSETGIPLSKYIVNVRINHAEQLLKEEADKSITEIAYACGFNDSNYFSCVFKKETGLSPTNFRKKYKLEK